jgi:VanZ family protein
MKKRYVKWALVVIWAIVIFVFSSQSGEISNENNKFIVEILSRIGINLDSITGGIANFIIRKAAHFTEYFILYMLLYNALIDDFYPMSTFILAISLTFLYAASDEIHQMFVPGRGPAVLDVFIDTSGGATAALVLYIKDIIFKRNKKSVIYHYIEKDLD